MAYINVGNGPGLVANSIVTLFITWVLSSMRIYIRRILLKAWALEDWLFLGSQIFFTILAICALLAAVHGNGQRVADIALKDLPVAMQYWFACELLYVITAILMRLSIGFFILRIAPQKIYSWIIKITMGIITLFSVIVFFFNIFQCQPVSFFWRQFSGLHGKCFPKMVVQNGIIAYSVLCLITDVIFSILPLFVIWKLKMNPKAKIICGGLLAIGLLASLTVIIRIDAIKKVSLTEDFLFATSNVSIWSMIEPAIGISCMAASTFRPLFKSLRERTNTHDDSYENKSNKNSSNVASNSDGSVPTHGDFRSSYLRGMGKSAHHGYLKSMDTKNSNSFENIIGMENMAVNGEDMSESRSGRSEEIGLGIMKETRVEIKSVPRGDDAV